MYQVENVNVLKRLWFRGFVVDAFKKFALLRVEFYHHLIPFDSILNLNKNKYTSYKVFLLSVV